MLREFLSYLKTSNLNCTSISYDGVGESKLDELSGWFLVNDPDVLCVLSSLF